MKMKPRRGPSCRSGQWTFLSTCSVITGLIHGIVLSASGAEEDAPKAPERPATHELKAGQLRIKAELDAVFESAEQHALLFDPKAWNDLSVVEVVEHGARVKEGDVLVQLETEKLEEQIRDLEESEESGRLALEQAVAELENLRKTTPLKLEAAQRSKRRAEEDYEYFQETDRAQKMKNVEFGIKSAEQRLENAKEEMDQLRKMYEADDLTEETEEIVLKRQRYAVEAAEYFLEGAKLNATRSLEILIARDFENLKSQRIESELALELAEQSIPNGLEQKEQAIGKMKRDRRKAMDKLSDYRHDLELMALRSPIDGLVYYGACEEGKWTTGAAVAKKLKPGGKLAGKEVVMTVVNPRKLQLQAVVAEKDLAALEKGAEGTAKLVADPDRECPVKLKSLSGVPQPGGGYPAVLAVSLSEENRVVPGMNAKVTFSSKFASEGVLAPKKAVFADGDEQVVYVWIEEGKPERRVVKTGRSDDTLIDLIEGVTAGERVLLEKPKTEA